LSGSDPHWLKLTGDDCYTYDANPTPGETATWSGDCQNRLASGTGLLTFHMRDGVQRISGTKVDGYFEGPVTIDSVGHGLIHEEGTMVRDSMSGFIRQESRDSNRSLVKKYEGNASNGKYSGQGHLLLYRPDGSISLDYNGTFVDGEPANGTKFAQNTIDPTPRVELAAVAQTNMSAQQVAADIADISAYEKSLHYSAYELNGSAVGQIAYTAIQGDPSASKLETKLIVAFGFYKRSFMVPDPQRYGQMKGDYEAWQKDLSKLKDEETAKRWYEAVVYQASKSYPDVDFYAPFDYALTKKIPLYVDLMNAAHRLQKFPSEAVIANYRLPLEQQQREDQIAADNTQKAQESKKLAWQKALPARLAAKKTVGDTVCDDDNNIVGQVDRVENDKILVRTHMHRDYYRSFLSATKVGADDWDQSNWIAYKSVIRCE